MILIPIDLYLFNVNVVFLGESSQATNKITVFSYPALLREETVPISFIPYIIYFNLFFKALLEAKYYYYRRNNT